MIQGLLAAVAVVGAIIAWGQYSLAQDRLRHDLYDRRYKVFEGARKFLAEIMRDGNCTYEQIFEFTRCTGDAVFLLDGRLVAYFEEMRTRAFDVIKAEIVAIQQPPHPERSAAIDRKYVQITWFVEQFPILVLKFKPFLQLERPWRAWLRRNLSV